MYKNNFVHILNIDLLKKRIRYKIILVGALFSFFSCSNLTEKEKADRAIKKLTSRYYELQKGDSDYYKLVRSVIYGDHDFEIQLRSEPDSISDRQSLIIFINSKREYYAIPFFSNTYIDYWEFPHEKSSIKKKKLTDTFNRELRRALLFLKLDKKVELFDVAEEMRHSLLSCTDIMQKDSLLINTPFVLFGTYPVDEEKKEVKQRLNKNYSDIMRNSNTYVLYHKKFIVAYLDSGNYRIYQFIYNHDGTFSINCYRQDRKLNLTYM